MLSKRIHTKGGLLTLYGQTLLDIENELELITNKLLKYSNLAKSTKNTDQRKEYKDKYKYYINLRSERKERIAYIENQLQTLFNKSLDFEEKEQAEKVQRIARRVSDKLEAPERPKTVIEPTETATKETPIIKPIVVKQVAAESTVVETPAKEATRTEKEATRAETTVREQTRTERDAPVTRAETTKEQTRAETTKEQTRAETTVKEARAETTVREPTVKEATDAELKEIVKKLKENTSKQQHVEPPIQRRRKSAVMIKKKKDNNSLSDLFSMDSDLSESSL